MRGTRSLNLMSVVSPDALRAVTDPAAVLDTAGAGAGAGGEGAVPAVRDLPLSAVCARLFR